jgi:hypothetical protein
LQETSEEDASEIDVAHVTSEDDPHKKKARIEDFFDVTVIKKKQPSASIRTAKQVDIRDAVKCARAMPQGKSILNDVSHII